MAAKTAQADFIFITGTDAWGAAQTESLDVTAGNGTYTTTKRFQTITNLDCSDNAAGGGAVWADGTIQVTQDIWGVIWDKGKGVYQLDCTGFDIGNGSTSTYFATEEEVIIYNIHTNAKPIKVTANAILRSGVKIDSSYGYKGSAWKWPRDEGDQVYESGLGSESAGTGDMLIYDSKFWCTYWDAANLWRSPIINLYSDSTEMIDCLVSGINKVQVWKSDPTINTTRITQCYYNLKIAESAVSISDVGIKTGSSGELQFHFPTADPVDISGISVSTVSLVWMTTAYSYRLIDSAEPTVSGPTVNGDNKFYLSYTTNVHVSDKDGNNLSGVTVDCEDTNGTACWTAGSITTDANGDIAEQIINYKAWSKPNGGVVVETFSPHKFTISKAGYEMLVMENITVDASIVWELELQPMRARNYARSRVQGVQFQ